VTHNFANFVQRERRSLSEDPIDTQFNWTGGSVRMKTTAPYGRCERRLVCGELAIGISFPNAGSAAQWRLDGKLALDKIWTSAGGSHDLVILPPGREFWGRCRGSGQGLWIFVDPSLISDDGRIKSFGERARVDCSWAKDRLSWMVATELRNECENGFPRGPMF
jgi:AraC family transcriptional regulator